jgi:predicted NAD-dependent protein-ADP-ribosyltransferase YbiA (DUF1768 family)
MPQKEHLPVGATAQFYSKSKDVDDLGLGLPNWRKILSNFYACEICIDERRYASVEHAFHAAKARCSDKPSIAAAFEIGGSVPRDPAKAKQAGGRAGFHRLGATLDVARWASERDGATMQALRARLSCDASFREILAACDARQLQLLHFERGGDRSYWGGSIRSSDGSQVGQNRLGRMLMELAPEAAAAVGAAAAAGRSSDAGAAQRQLCVLARTQGVAAGGCLLRLIAPTLEPRSRTDFSALDATALLVTIREEQRHGQATVSIEPAAGSGVSDSDGSWTSIPQAERPKRRRLEHGHSPCCCPLGSGTWWTQLCASATAGAGAGAGAATAARRLPPPAAPLGRRGIRLAACAIPLDQHDRVLLTRRPRTMRTFPGCWVLPGGAVDPGEATHAAYARRFHPLLSVWTEIYLCYTCSFHEILRMDRAMRELAEETGLLPATTTTALEDPTPLAMWER